MRDVAVLGGLAIAFAAWVTVHVALVVGLARRHPRWRAPVALVVLPLAPWWGRAAGMRARAFLWVALVCVYALLRALASL